LLNIIGGLAEVLNVQENRRSEGEKMKKLF
jgi:hypothetical protein